MISIPFGGAPICRHRGRRALRTAASRVAEARPALLRAGLVAPRGAAGLTGKRHRPARARPESTTRPGSSPTAQARPRQSQASVRNGGARVAACRQRCAPGVSPAGPPTIRSNFSDRCPRARCALSRTGRRSSRAASADSALPEPGTAESQATRLPVPLREGSPAGLRASRATAAAATSLPGPANGSGTGRSMPRLAMRACRLTISRCRPGLGKCQRVRTLRCPRPRRLFPSDERSERPNGRSTKQHSTTLMRSGGSSRYREGLRFPPLAGEESDPPQADLAVDC